MGGEIDMANHDRWIIGMVVGVLVVAIAVGGYVAPGTIITQLIALLVGGFGGGYLTYVFAWRKSMKETILIETIKLYRPLIELLPRIMEEHDPKEWKDMEGEINQLYGELLLFAPDHIVNDFHALMATIRRGKPAQPTFDLYRKLMITLRKELLEETNIKPENIGRIEVRVYESETGVGGSSE